MVVLLTFTRTYTNLTSAIILLMILFLAGGLSLPGGRLRRCIRPVRHLLRSSRFPLALRLQLLRQGADQPRWHHSADRLLLIAAIAKRPDNKRPRYCSVSVCPLYIIR